MYIGQSFYYIIKKQQTICQNCLKRWKECNVCIHNYTCTCPNSLLSVTMCKDIHLVIKYINSHMNYIPGEPSNVPVKSLNVGNEVFCEVKLLGEYTIATAIKQDIQRDMDHLYVLLDQCTDEYILQQIRAALNLVDANIIEVSSRFNRLSNKSANKVLSSQKQLFSTQKHRKTPSTKITKSTKKNMS